MRRVLTVAFVALSFSFEAAALAQPFKNGSNVVLTFLSHRSGHNQLYKSQPDGFPQAVPRNGQSVDEIVRAAPEVLPKVSQDLLTGNLP